MADQLTPSLPALSLAFLGDAVWELFVRSQVLGSGVTRLRDLHTATVAAVSAAGQRRALASTAPLLSAEEGDVVRRARNARVAGGASAEERAASAWESLLGHLYVSGQADRLAELLWAGWAGIQE